MQTVVHCCCPTRSEHSAMMKVSWLCCLSVVATVSAGGIAWPGAIPVASASLPPLAPLANRIAAPVLAYTASLGIPAYNTLLGAPATKGFAYSTTQYINSSPYSFGYKPQFAFQVPQFGAFAPVQTVGYYPAISNPIVPGIFPSLPEYVQNPSGAAPSYPSQSPSPQPSGESDSTIIESANSDSNKFISNQQFSGQPVPSYPEASSPQPPQPPQGPPASTFPVFAPEQQDSSSPSFPSLPSLPSFPQGSVPNFPQFPQFPQFPLFPQTPGSGSPAPPAAPQAPPQAPPSEPPASFPAAENNDRGLNDEDTISIESA